MASVTSLLRSAPRALPPMCNSPTELERFHDKLAFYEQPITSFNRPVENDPSELILVQPTQRIDRGAVDNRRKPIQASVERPCVLVRFARRAMTAMRTLLSTRRGRGRHDDPTRRGGMAIQEKRPSAAKTRLNYRPRGMPKPPIAETPARLARRRFQEMDESMRFRLELAGIRVQSTPTSYTVCV